MAYATYWGVYNVFESDGRLFHEVWVPDVRDAVGCGETLDVALSAASARLAREPCDHLPPASTKEDVWIFGVENVNDPLCQEFKTRFMGVVAVGALPSGGVPDDVVAHLNRLALER